MRERSEKGGGRKKKKKKKKGRGGGKKERKQMERRALHVARETYTDGGYGYDMGRARDARDARNRVMRIARARAEGRSVAWKSGGVRSVES